MTYLFGHHLMEAPKWIFLLFCMHFSSYLPGTHLLGGKRVSGKMPKSCEPFCSGSKPARPDPSLGPLTTATSPSSVSKWVLVNLLLKKGRQMEAKPSNQQRSVGTKIAQDVKGVCSSVAWPAFMFFYRSLP